MLSVAIAIDYPIAALDKLKSAGPAPAAAAPAKEEKAAAKKEEKEEPKEEEDDDMGFGLFD